MDNLWLIVGLGNPGKEYQKTRHNAGFLALDALLEKLSHNTRASSSFHLEKKFLSEIVEASSEACRLILVKPQTYMNLSGNAVLALAQFYKVVPEQIIVIHDELDIPLGEIKIKQGGGSGGHNGIKSIDSTLPSNNYFRIRVGIGNPRSETAEADRDQVVKHVLDAFSKAETLVLDEMLHDTAEAALIIPKNGLAPSQKFLSGQKSKRIKAREGSAAS